MIIKGFVWIKMVNLTNKTQWNFKDLNFLHINASMKYSQ